jgi:hypothetical protein
MPWPFVYSRKQPESTTAALKVRTGSLRD